MPTQIQAVAGGQPYAVQAENISVGGMLIRTKETLEEGAVVHLTFTLPGTKHKIEVQGIVQHVSPGAFMGVRFEKLSKAHEDAVLNFVESTEPLP